MAPKKKLGRRDEQAKQPISLPEVFVTGNFIDNLSLIRSTSMSSVIGIGRVAGVSGERPIDSTPKTLIPYVALSMAGQQASEEEPSPIYYGVLPLENAAHLIWDLSFELTDVLGEINDLSSSNIAIEPHRLKFTRQLLAQIQAKVSECCAIMDGMPGVGEARKEARPTD